jgi:hypothetical protein
MIFCLPRRPLVFLLFLALGVAAFSGCRSVSPPPRQLTWLEQWRQQNPIWRGVHLWVDRESSAQELIQTLPALAAIGVNAVVIEVNYSYEFESHPELRNRHFITRATAHQLAHAARDSGIRLIPQFNCLGHQSFGGRIGPLLREHPDFNETPGETPETPGMYSLCWCPLAPGLHEIVYSLMDEIAEGFEADAFHAGMDEVYCIGSPECPRCQGKNPADLFAGEVNAVHEHLVNERHLEMLMWADRVIGVKYQGHSKYDNAGNDTSGSISLIPRDIIMCDWHYEKRTNYTSLPYLIGQNFRVWPSGFAPVSAARALSDCAQAQNSKLVIGWLATTWNKTSISRSPEYPPIREIIPLWNPAKKSAAPETSKAAVSKTGS